MNSERLLQYFDRIVDMPDAIPRLRRFILDLAVRGKLVEQDPSEESPARLLAQIDRKKRLSGSSLVLKSLAIAPPNAPDLWNIPEGWKFIQLGKLPSLDGIFVDGDWVESKDQDPNGEVRLIQLADVGAGEFRDRSSRFLTFETAKRLNCTFLDVGDILIARMPDPIGRACSFPGDDRKSVTVVDVAILRPAIEDLSISFLVHAINSPQFGTNVTRYTAGTTRNRISRSKLATLPLPFPPLAEQHRIVAKVDELMGLCDRLEAGQAERERQRDRLVAASLHAMNQVVRATQGPASDNFREQLRFYFSHLPLLTTRLEHTKQLRQTILNLAIRGKLVPQDPNGEPIHGTLRLAMKQRQSLGRSKKARHRKLGDCEDLVNQDDLPENWTVERLGNLVDPENTISYGVLVPGNDVRDGIPFVRAQDLSLSSHPERPNKTISPDIEKAYARTRLRGGEILLCVVGSIGKLGIAPSFWAGANIARAVVRIVPIPEISRDYLLVALRGHSVQTYFAEATRTLAQPTLNVSLIEQTPIPLPPLAEQLLIVAKVDELMDLCDQLEAQITASQRDRHRLLEGVLHEALYSTDERDVP